MCPFSFIPTVLEVSSPIVFREMFGSEVGEENKGAEGAS